MVEEDMSRTRRDFLNEKEYTTPDWCAAAGVEVAKHFIESPARILEPGCGETAPFARKAAEVWPDATILVNEYRDLPLPFPGSVGSFMDVQVKETFDLIIGNPPFRLMSQFVAKGLDLLAPNGFMIYLARLNWLCGLSRHEFFKRSENRPLEINVISPRPSFCLNKNGQKGSDGTDYAFYVWHSRQAAHQWDFQHLRKGHFSWVYRTENV